MCKPKNPSLGEGSEGGGGGEGYGHFLEPLGNVLCLCQALFDFVRPR